MNYFKSIVKNVYQKVLQDQYLQQISQQQLYFIINNYTRSRLFSTGKDPRKLSTSQPEKDLFEKVDMMGNLTPERQFRILGADPKLQIVAARAKDLNEDLDQVTNLMKQNFAKYERKLNQAIDELDNIKNMYTARLYSMELRTKLKRLEEATKKSKRIAELHIKKQNIKLVQKTLLEIPNLKKMTLTQLKSINKENYKNRAILSNLNCLKGLQEFIDRAVAQQLTQVLHILQQCFTNQFDEKLYENALRDFIVAQNSNIQYEKLLIRLLQKQIRKIDGDLNGDIYQICQFYIRLMINLHGAFRWHRLNETEQKWQELSRGCYGISIEIDINHVTKSLIAEMDDCLKIIILHKFYHNEGKITQNLENLYLICRMSQIAFTFSGEYFQYTLKQTTECLIKILCKIKERAMIQLEQTLKNQNKNCWNRLPVVDDYSHEPVDRSLYQMYRHRGREDYIKMIEVLRKSKDMLKDVKINITHMKDLCNKDNMDGNLWDSLWADGNILQANEHKLKKKQSTSSSQDNKSTGPPKNKTSQINEEQKQVEVDQFVNNITQQYKQLEENWEIEAISFPHIEKYQKYKNQIRVKSKSVANNYTIICQYSLNILKYIQIFTKNTFYYPIEPIISFSFSTISLTLQYYIYHIFNSFLSKQLKNLFYKNFQNFTEIEEKYHKKRLHYQYPTTTKFMLNFKNSKMVEKQKLNQTDTSQNKENLIIRSRVVALESFAYLLQYYEHIMKITGFYGSHEPIVNSQKHILDQKSEKKINTITSLPSFNQNNLSHYSISQIHPEISAKIGQKLALYQTLYLQLSQLIYTHCIPKLCNLESIHQLVQNIKWDDEDTNIHEYVEILNKTYSEFFYKMNSANRGQVPLAINQKIFGVYWKTQLTAIMKSFTYKSTIDRYVKSISLNAKHKLQKFIDALYTNISALIYQKQYIRIPYEKIKAIFPILMENSWQNTLDLFKQTLDRYQFIYALEIGMVESSESCSHVGSEQLKQRRRILQDLILNKASSEP